MPIRDCLRAEWLYKLSVYLCATAPLCLGLMWIYTFGFTSYRIHLRWVGIPSGIAFVALAAGMMWLRTWAVMISVVLATATTIFSFMIALFGLWFYWIVVLLGITYVAIVFEQFRERENWK